MRIILLNLIISLLLSITSFSATAQQRVRIFGTVVNQDGAALSGVTIRIEDKEAHHTNAQGYFEFKQTHSLPLTISATAIGYQPISLLVDKQLWDSQKGILLKLTKKDIELDEILVTGRRNNSYLINTTELGGKLSGTLKDLPQSISLVTKEFMEDKQAFVMNDIIQDLGGVNQASVYDELTIRGFKSGYETGFRLVNGMRSGYGFGNSSFRTPLIANLENIEILKGPGASLFGDISPGGTINMVTKKPLEKRYANANISLGSFQTLRSTVDLGGPIDSAKKILYRLNIGYENSRTFRDINQRKTTLIAPSFTFKPVQGTIIDIDLIYDNFNGYLDRGLAIKNNDLYAQSRSFSVGQPSDFFRTNFLSFSGRLTQTLTDKLSLHVNYMRTIYSEELNEFRTLNTYADAPKNTIMNMRYLDRKMKDYTDNMVSYLNYSIKNDAVSHRLVLGVDYAQYGGDKDNYQREARQRTLNGQNVPLTIDLENPNREIMAVSSFVWRAQAPFPFLSPYNTWGFYLQDQMAIGKRLKMVMGLRHEYYRSSSENLTETDQVSQHSWLPRLGLTYIINEQINYFASYSKGYVPVGFNFIHNYKNYGATEAFKPERSFQVETGLKMGFFKNQLQTELSLFHIAKQNMLLATGSISDAGFPVYQQTGEAISQGVELDFRGQINKEFQIMANYSFNHTKVVSSFLTDEVGMPLPDAPKNMGGMWLKYIFSKYKVKGLGFGAGVYYVGDRRMVDQSNMKDRWPAYTTVNTAVYYNLKSMRITANMNNIFDKYYYLGGFNYTRGFVGTPRNFMLSVGFYL